MSFRFPKRIVTAVADLHASCIDVKPVNYDWDAKDHADYGDNEDGWRFWCGVRCQACDTVVAVDSEGEPQHSDVDDDADCDGELENGSPPMMSYWYSLERSRNFDPQSAAIAIVDLPLCIVEVAGEYGLALTGGGMDLSWEIARAFICLGELPPLHFVGRLPRMSGLTLDDEHMLVLAAARKSAEIVVSRAQRDVESIDQLAADLAADTKRSSAKPVRRAKKSKR